MKVSRRELFLKYGPAALLAIPIFRATRGFAQTEEPIRRFVTFYSSSGVRQDIFWPTGTPGLFGSGNYSVQGTSLEALEPFLDRTIIPRGISIDRGSGDSHDAGSVAILTGDHLELTDEDAGSQYAKGQSLDTYLADTIGAQTPEGALLTGTRLQVNRISKWISYDQNGNYQDYIQNPYTLYDRIFRHIVNVECSEGSSQLEALERLRIRRRSVLDTVLSETTSMQRSYGMSQEEKIKLEQMQDGIRDVERRLEEPTATQTGVSDTRCANVREVFETDDPVSNNDENFPALLNLHLDLIALAFELDITRVATISLSLGGSGGAPMRWVKWRDDDGNEYPIEASHHNVSHGTQRGVENHRAKLKAIDRWNFEQFAGLLGRLDAINEGDATALDNSLVWYATDVGNGRTHDRVNLPFIIAGRGAGALPSGRYVEMSNEPPHQRLLSTFLAAMTSDAESQWGRPESAQDGPLSF